MKVLELLLAGLVGSLPMLITSVIQARKQPAETKKIESETAREKAEAADQLTETAMQLLAPLRERIQELEKASRRQTEAVKELGQKLDKANRLIRALLRGISVLMHQLQELGVTPAFVVPIVDDSSIEQLEERFVEYLREDL